MKRVNTPFARRTTWLILALAVAVSVSGYGQMPVNPLMVPLENFPDGFGTQGGEYTFAISSPPITLNPLLAADHPASQQAAELAGVAVFPALLDGFYQEPLSLTTGLLESLELDDLADPTQITMKLREGLRWSDGEPITSLDAEFTFAVHTDVRYRAFTGFAGLLISNRFPGFERVDERTWIYHLPGPVDAGAYLSQLNALTLLPRHVHQAAFNQGALASLDYWSAKVARETPQRIVGAGPFRLLSVAEDGAWVFERNPHYWKADAQGTQLPYFDAVRMRVVADRDVQFSMFINGELDRFSLQPGDLAALRGVNDLNIKTEVLQPEFNATADFISFNQDIGLIVQDGLPASAGDPYLDSLRQLFRSAEFRRAISQATDRQAIVNNVYLGFAVPIYQMSGLGVFDISGWPGGAGQQEPDFPVEFSEFDLQAANGLLDQLDLPRERNGERTFGQSYPAAGEPVRIVLSTNVENPTRVLVAQLLTDAYTSDLGLTFGVTLASFQDTLDALFEFEASERQRFGAWQSVYVGIGGGSDASEALSQLTSQGMLHIYRYSDALTDSPFATQRRIDELWQQQNAIMPTASTGSVGGLSGYIFRSPAERFELIREIQLLAAREQNNVYTAVGNPLVAFYANRVGNVRKSALEQGAAFKSLLSFFERGFRIKSRPGGNPDITP